MPADTQYRADLATCKQLHDQWLHQGMKAAGLITAAHGVQASILGNTRILKRDKQETIVLEFDELTAKAEAIKSEHADTQRAFTRVQERLLDPTARDHQQPAPAELALQNAAWTRHERALRAADRNGAIAVTDGIIEHASRVNDSATLDALRAELPAFLRAVYDLEMPEAVAVRLDYLSSYEPIIDARQIAKNIEPRWRATFDINSAARAIRPGRQLRSFVVAGVTGGVHYIDGRDQ